MNSHGEFDAVFFVCVGGCADDEVEEAEEAGAVPMLDSSTIGKHSFTAMAGDHDRLTRQRLQRSPNELHTIQHERV